MGLHLFLGTGGETGNALGERLIARGDKVVTTSHRKPPAPTADHAILRWRLERSREDTPLLLQALGSDRLSSLSVFSHPSFRRSPADSAPPEDLLLDLFPSLKSLLDALSPRLDTGTPLLFFFPSLSRHRAGGYLPARLWIGALKGLFEEWSRNPKGLPVTGLEILVSPDPEKPHLTKDFVERIAGRTARGRLATAHEIADFAAWLILARSPLFHGQILHTEGGPYF